MKKRVKIVDITVKYVNVEVDSTDEMEIRAELDYMSCNGQIDWDRYDECESYIEVMED